MASEVSTTNKQKGFNQDRPAFSVDIFPNENVIRKDGFHICIPFLGTAGATAANYDQFFTAMRPIEILSVSASWSTASSSGTLQIEKLTGTQAPGAGSTILASTISTAGAANTVVTRQGNQLTSARQLKPGNRLAFIDGGTLTGLVALHVTLYFKFIGRGDYL